jgi:hypothetical protein
MRGTSSPSSKSLVVSSSTMVVVVKGEDSSLNGLTHSQNWPVGFGPFGEIIIGDQGGEHRDGMDSVSPEPLNVYHSKGFSLSEVVVEWDDGADDFFLDPLDWIYSDEDEDPTLALLKAVEEDLHQEVKVACSKSKGKRELFNLKSFVNYGNSYTSNRRRKGKVHER